ncbi:MAG: hypothetical protein ACYCW6_05810 [Candidatus Xenobia bacterium]
MKSMYWVAAFLVVALLTGGTAFAQEVIISSPPPAVVMPAPLPPPAPPVVATPIPGTASFLPGDQFVAPGMAAVSTAGGLTYIPIGGTDGYVLAPGGGQVHYWTDGYGTTYYQYYDPSGHRHHRHHL